jgi:hypothetical protein
MTAAQTETQLALHNKQQEEADDDTAGKDNRFAALPEDTLPENKVYLFPPRLYSRRYEARIKLDESEDPAAEAGAKLKAFYKAIHDSNKSVIMYPWKDELNKGGPNTRKHKPITRASDIPSMPGAWKVFFRPSNTSGQRRVDVHLGILRAQQTV